MFKKDNSMFSTSKYGNLLTVILVIAIIAIIGIIIFIGYNIYKKYYIEKGAEEAVAQFENITGNNDNNVVDNTTKQDLSAIGEGMDSTSGSSGVKTKYKGFNVRNKFNSENLFTESRIKNDKVDTPYTKRENRSVEYMEKCEIEGVSPQKIAKVICKKAERKNPPLSFAIGFPYKIARLAYRIFPQKFVSFVLYLIYGK